MREWIVWATHEINVRIQLTGSVLILDANRFSKIQSIFDDFLRYDKRRTFSIVILLHSFFTLVTNFCLYKLSRFVSVIFNSREKLCWAQTEFGRMGWARCTSGVLNSVTRNRRKIATVPSGGETISPWKRCSAIEDPRNARPCRIESALPNGTQIQ